MLQAKCYWNSWSEIIFSQAAQGLEAQGSFRKQRVLELGFEDSYDFNRAIW